MLSAQSTRICIKTIKKNYVHMYRHWLVQTGVYFIRALFFKSSLFMECSLEFHVSFEFVVIIVIIISLLLFTFFLAINHFKSNAAKQKPENWVVYK